MNTPTLTGTYTCTHHNDQMRAACPVCLVATLTAERDKAEAQLHALRLVCGTTDANKFETWTDRANARAERAEAELAAERARLDWVFRNCKVEADDYTTGNRDVYAIHDREDLGAAMKEGAK
jgi:hypothetical protein